MAKKHSTAAKRPRGTPASSRISKAQADKILSDYNERPALMTQETMFELDGAIMKDKFGVTRRTALLFLTKPCCEFIQNVGADRDFAVATASMLDSIARYKDCLGELQEWMEEAEKRVLIALATREDMGAVMDEGKASNARANTSLEVSHA